MAAALLAPVGEFASRKARSFAQEIQQDALGYFQGATRKIGAGMLVAGVACGLVGWYLQAAATTAANNESTVLYNIGTIFSNIKAPTFTPAAMGTAPILTANPLADIQNFFSDAWADITGLGADVAQVGGILGTLGEDVAMAIIDVGKAILAFVMHFPDILWNGMVWGVGGAVATILNWLFPYLILFGLILIGVSIGLGAVKWAWTSFVKEPFASSLGKLQDRLEERGTRFWDKVFRNPSPPGVEVPESLPALPVPSEASEPVPVAENASTALETAPILVPEAPAAAPEPLETVKETNGDTVQTEQILGGVPPPGWSEEDMAKYLKKAAPKAEPEPLTGKEYAIGATELLA